MNARNELYSEQPWFMGPDVLDSTLSAQPSMLATRDDPTRDDFPIVSMRDGVAVITVNGILFRGGGFFSRFLGRPSVDDIAKAFQTALDDDGVSAILFHFLDSPGGLASGISELGDLIFNARGEKPIWAYVSGAALSAAYFFGAAVDRLLISDLAQVGGIGVVSVMRRRRGDEDTIEIVSSNAPRKRAADAKQARDAVQTIVDDLEAVFINHVALYRGVSADTVINDFGQGASVVGQRAVDAGLADGLSTFEATMSDLASRISTSTSDGRFSAMGETATTSTDANTVETVAAPVVTAQYVQEKHPDVFSAIKATGHEEGAKAAAERISGILGCDEAKERGPQAVHIALQTELTVEQAKGLLNTMPTQPAGEKKPEASGLETSMSDVENPDIEPDPTHTPKSDADRAAAAVAQVVDLGLFAKGN